MVANEPGVRLEFIPGTENIGADLLSRPTSGKEQEDTPGPLTDEVYQVSIWDEIWDEHLKAHWGVYKTHEALKRRGIQVSIEKVKEVCRMCEVCAKFRQAHNHAKYGQP